MINKTLSLKEIQKLTPIDKTLLSTVQRVHIQKLHFQTPKQYIVLMTTNLNTTTV